MIQVERLYLVSSNCFIFPQICYQKNVYGKILEVLGSNKTIWTLLENIYNQLLFCFLDFWTASETINQRNRFGNGRRRQQPRYLATCKSTTAEFFPDYCCNGNDSPSKTRIMIILLCFYFSLKLTKRKKWKMFSCRWSPLDDSVRVSHLFG